MTGQDVQDLSSIPEQQCYGQVVSRSLYVGAMPLLTASTTLLC